MTPNRAWTTPRVLHYLRTAIWITAALFLLSCCYAIRVYRGAVQTIGRDAVPSIIAAEKLKVALSDLDANVVNSLITPPWLDSSSIKGYVPRRQEITDSLISAAENITYGDLERKPLRRLTNALSAYERLAIKAQTLHLRKDETGAVSTYRDALTQLQEELLPAADDLAKANAEALERETRAQQTDDVAATASVVFSGALLLSTLVATQIFLTRRMRRTLNPALLAATLLTAAMVFNTVSKLNRAYDDVRSAHDDSFASLSTLYYARATAYDANSNESRWIFDKERRPILEKAFFEECSKLVNLPTSGTPAAVVTATANGTLPAGSTGYFADELKNITFAGEGPAAAETVRTFGVYFGKDAHLRNLENTGQHAEAVRFDTGMNAGDSNFAFAQFDNALGSTIDINQKAFDTSVDSGFGTLQSGEAIVGVGALIVALLNYFGLRPRLKEYDI